MSLGDWVALTFKTDHVVRFKLTSNTLTFYLHLFLSCLLENETIKHTKFWSAANDIENIAVKMQII
jgi:hypothetical protein